MVHWEQDGPVAILRIDNPPVNVLSRAVRDGLAAGLDRAAAEAAVRVVVITGTGERAFCAGADLAEESGLGPAAAPAFFVATEALLHRVYHFPRPVIAALNSHALGAGFELALACDLRVASAGATLCNPAVNVGLVASTHRLTRLLGESRAKEMCLTGRRVSAAEAWQWGLVHRVAEPEAFWAAALDLAREVAGKAPLSLQRTKAAINRALDLTLDQAIARQRQDALTLQQSADHQEAVAAFKGRRKPRFRGE